MKLYTKHIVDRLSQLKDEIVHSHRTIFYDRLWAFADYCRKVVPIKIQLDILAYSVSDLDEDILYPDLWPVGKESYARRWKAIESALKGYSQGRDLIQMQSPSQNGFLIKSYAEFTQIIVIPLFNYLIDNIKLSSNILHLLVRYKRWVEWFEEDRLNKVYQQALSNEESLLDKDLRRFLFENGIDYPYSQPRSPRGQADIVAGLETDDPLILEVKIWDSSKGYKENRIRDGLRQVQHYAAKYGKDSGYVVVFNHDPIPLVFESPKDSGLWPARLESGGTYYFIAVDIDLRKVPISQSKKGKKVEINKVQLANLLSNEK